MKIYFRNKAARLTLGSLFPTCTRCPFYDSTPCPFGMSGILDCTGKGSWVDGESPEIFKL